VNSYFLFVSLAGNQTAFFEALVRGLASGGIAGGVVCFHERSHEHLRRVGVESWNAIRMAEEASPEVDWAVYGIDNAQFWIGHEKAAFELRASDPLLVKFARYLQVAERILRQLLGRGVRPVVFQELGGFLACLSVFFAARRLGIDHWFVEPSFFRGRVFFTRNTIRAPRVPGPAAMEPSPEVLRYLERVSVRREAVIPVKDRHHYRDARRKILDRRNWVRLAEKLRDKYLLGKREEFEHVGGHVQRHVRMAINSRVLRRWHRALTGVERFVYYPLHVPADVALTLRSPEWLDQYALIDCLCRSVPPGYRVAIKEHPALVGALSVGRLRELLRRHDNLVLLDPSLNNYEVLERAAAVVTVNSKAGAEALLKGRPVLVLGDAFYRDCSLVRRADRWPWLPEAVTGLLRDPPRVPEEDVPRYFQDVWNASRPGEIYDASTQNIREFVRSMLDVVRPQEENILQ